MSEVLKLREGAVEWREIEGEVVALDRKASEYVAVNRSGAALWPRLVVGASRDELVAALVARYGIDEARAGADVDAFVASLRGRELLDE